MLCSVLLPYCTPGWGEGGGSWPGLPCCYFSMHQIVFMSSRCPAAQPGPTQPRHCSPVAASASAGLVPSLLLSSPGSNQTWGHVLSPRSLQVT